MANVGVIIAVVTVLVIIVIWIIGYTWVSNERRKGESIEIMLPKILALCEDSVLTSFKASKLLVSAEHASSMEEHLAAIEMAKTTNAMAVQKADAAAAALTKVIILATFSLDLHAKDDIAHAKAMINKARDAILTNTKNAPRIIAHYKTYGPPPSATRDTSSTEPPPTVSESKVSDDPPTIAPPPVIPITIPESKVSDDPPTVDQEIDTDRALAETYGFSGECTRGACMRGIVRATGATCRAIGGAMNGAPPDSAWTDCHINLGQNGARGVLPAGQCPAGATCYSAGIEMSEADCRAIGGSFGEIMSGSKRLCSVGLGPTSQYDFLPPAKCSTDACRAMRITADADSCRAFGGIPDGDGAGWMACALRLGPSTLART